MRYYRWLVWPDGRRERWAVGSVRFMPDGSRVTLPPTDGKGYATDETVPAICPPTPDFIRWPPVQPTGGFFMPEDRKAEMARLQRKATAETVGELVLEGGRVLLTIAAFIVAAAFLVDWLR